MNKPRKFVTFDWAMKKVLRSKVNFDVLEGFLSELLKEDITIESVLESESDRESADNKLTRVDLMVRNSAQQQVIIEIQYDREPDYFQRMMYGTSKAIAENLTSGTAYSQAIKVISVNIVFFDLGQGEDYVYVGNNTFHGLHTNDELELSEYQKTTFKVKNVSEIFPTYYLLKVNKFDDVAKDGLDEWLYFLKNEEIKSEFNAKGLKAAKEKLNILKLNSKERYAYDQFQHLLHVKASLNEHPFKELEESRIREEELRQSVEESRLREEEAQARAEESRLREEEAQARAEESRVREESFTQVALKALISTGLPEDEAKAQLGIEN